MSNNAWTNSNPPARVTQYDEATFNPNEVRDCLKHGFQSATTQDGQSKTYAAASQSNSIKSAGAGSKAGMMANNKDFLLELRKQVTALQQGERSGG